MGGEHVSLESVAGKHLLVAPRFRTHVFSFCKLNSGGKISLSSSQAELGCGCVWCLRNKTEAGSAPEKVVSSFLGSLVVSNLDTEMHVSGEGPSSTVPPHLSIPLPHPLGDLNEHVGL